jgi:hypothetical protein
MPMNEVTSVIFSTKPPIQWVLWALSEDIINWQGREADQLVLKSRKTWIYTSTSQYSVTT